MKLAWGITMEGERVDRDDNCIHYDIHISPWRIRYELLREGVPMIAAVTADLAVAVWRAGG